MVSDPASIRLESEHVARSLADELPTLEAILLFGSVARGDPGPNSDIDLMVVSNEPLDGALARSWIQSCPRVSLVTHTWESLEQAKAEDWSFFVHLREEGQFLHGGRRLAEWLANVKRPPAESWRPALLEELESLSRFDDLTIFGGVYGFALGHIFTTARRTCMLDNTAAGEIAFDRDLAFEIFSQRHPKLTEETACVRAIWPFQARIQGRHVDLPFSANETKETEEALACARRIVCSVIDG